MEPAVDCKCLLYADDSARIVSDPCVKTIESKLSIELQKVRQRFIESKGSLQTGKNWMYLFWFSK